MVKKVKEMVIITFIIVRNVALNSKWNKRNVQDVEIRQWPKKKGKKILEKKSKSLNKIKSNEKKGKRDGKCGKKQKKFLIMPN